MTAKWHIWKWIHSGTPWNGVGCRAV
jgi:hypothetical protein